MGNGMNKVLPGLYIGNCRDAQDPEQISKNNITHIIAIHDSAKPSFENIVYKCVKISDSPGQNISVHFGDSIDFIHKSRTAGGNVLVHCIAGVSRSSTICSAYILTVTDLAWDEAILAVRTARKIVNPNYGFQKQLKNFQLHDAIKVQRKLLDTYGAFDPADVTYARNALNGLLKVNATFGAIMSTVYMLVCCGLLLFFLSKYHSLFWSAR